MKKRAWQVKKQMRRVWIILPLIAVFWACSHEKGAGHSAPKTILPKGYRQEYFKGMRYGFFVPQLIRTDRAYPLIVYLHGKKDTVSWDLGWYHDPVQGEDPCFVLTPKSVAETQGWGSSWNPEHSGDMKKTLALMDSLIAAYPIDTNRLYIHGASMGGFGVFSVLAKEPGLFAAAYAICGGGDPSTAKSLAGTPLWIFHGSEDDIVPVTFSRSLYDAILRAGGRKVRYTEYAGVGHAAWTPAGQEPDLAPWLLAQVKGARHGGPAPVRNVQATLLEEGGCRLSWDVPADTLGEDHRIWFYRVYKEGKALSDAGKSARVFVDTAGTAADLRAYSVASVNYFFEESKASSQ